MRSISKIVTLSSTLDIAATQSISIRFDCGAPPARLGISIIVDFSSSLSTLRFWMYGLSPCLKLAAHMMALVMVITMRMMVMTANVVRDFLAGM